MKIPALNIMCYLALFFLAFKSDKSAETVAAISADKMNMMYVGLDNPVSVSVSGYRPENLEVSISGGGEIKEEDHKGHYLVKPDGSARELTVIVAAKNNKNIVLSNKQFRVRKIPHPEVLLGTRNGGGISRGELATASQINVGLGEGFAFEGLKYIVNSYTLAIAPKSGQTYIEPVQGNRISGNSRLRLSNVKPGDLIVIANVDVTGPAGRIMLSGLTLTVK
jgi:hypothetical protein